MFLRLNHQYNSAHTLNLFHFCKHNHHNLSQPCLNSFDLCSCNSIILFHKHTHNHDLQIHIYSLNSQLHMSIHHINKTKALYECCRTSKNQRGIGWRFFRCSFCLVRWSRHLVINCGLLGNRMYWSCLRFMGKGLVVVREGISTTNAPYLR